MIRLIVQTSKDDRCFKSSGHLDTSYRVFEVENEAFEALIREGGSLTLIGLEVTEKSFAVPLQSMPAPALTPAQPVAPTPSIAAPVPALPCGDAKDGVPAPGLPLLPATRADTKETGLMRQRWGRWQWRRRLGLKPYPNPMMAGSHGVIKLPG